MKVCEAGNRVPVHSINQAKLAFGQLKVGAKIPFSIISPWLATWNAELRGKAIISFGGERQPGEILPMAIVKTRTLRPEMFPMIIENALSVKDEGWNRYNSGSIPFFKKMGENSRGIWSTRELKLGNGHVLLVKAEEAGDDKELFLVAAIIPKNILDAHGGKTRPFQDMGSSLMPRNGAEILLSEQITGYNPLSPRPAGDENA